MPIDTPVASSPFFGADNPRQESLSYEHDHHVDGVTYIEVLDDRGSIGSIVIHIVPIGYLAPAPVPPMVVGIG